MTVAHLRRSYGFPATDTQADPDKNRSIPACAGESGIYRADSVRSKVYSRVCGGSVKMTAPRAGTRSIPACAGEPPVTPKIGVVVWVYPRVCGGTMSSLSGGGQMQGLSPRVRGNPNSGGVRSTCARSIPACAGEPRVEFVHHLYLLVYPRVCGGTPLFLRRERSRCGLSPRVRGNRLYSRQRLIITRSIPACAGEPRNPIPTPW